MDLQIPWILARVKRKTLNEFCDWEAKIASMVSSERKNPFLKRHLLSKPGRRYKLRGHHNLFESLLWDSKKGFVLVVLLLFFGGALQHLTGALRHSFRPEMFQKGLYQFQPPYWGTEGLLA